MFRVKGFRVQVLEFGTATGCRCFSLCFEENGGKTEENLCRARGSSMRGSSIEIRIWGWGFTFAVFGFRNVRNRGRVPSFPMKHQVE